VPALHERAAHRAEVGGVGRPQLAALLQQRPAEEVRGRVRRRELRRAVEAVPRLHGGDGPAGEDRVRVRRGGVGVQGGVGEEEAQADVRWRGDGGGVGGRVRRGEAVPGLGLVRAVKGVVEEGAEEVGGAGARRGSGGAAVVQRLGGLEVAVPAREAGRQSSRSAGRHFTGPSVGRAGPSDEQR
jgi:hypothetical protein